MGSSNIDKLLAKKRYARRSFQTKTDSTEKEKTTTVTSTAPTIKLSKTKGPVKHKIIHKKVLVNSLYDWVKLIDWFEMLIVVSFWFWTAT